MHMFDATITLGCYREGETCWWAGPASASGPKARPRPASAPFPFSIFFDFFSKSKNAIFEALANLFRSWSKKKNCSAQKSLQLCFKMQVQIPNKI